MNSNESTSGRREFLKKSAFATAGIGAALSIPINLLATEKTDIDQLNIVGPKEGFSPHIGTLVSMMNWMRNTVLYPVRGMSVNDLDFLVDDKANSIGAMLWHLAATERYYQLHTFEEIPWGQWSLKEKQEWSIASGLGDKARKEIKGNSLSFYLEKLESVRAHTLSELAKRDDDWLMKVDSNFPWGPTNNYCKWFHVCEHESNHNGQFKFIKSRLPKNDEK